LWQQKKSIGVINYEMNHCIWNVGHCLYLELSELSWYYLYYMNNLCSLHSAYDAGNCLLSDMMSGIIIWLIFTPFVLTK